MLVEGVLVRVGDRLEVMDLLMNVAEVEGVRDDFLEPGEWMKNLLVLMALQMLVVWVVEWEGDMVEGVGDGGNEVPAKERDIEGEGLGVVVTVVEREDKLGKEGRRKSEWPVKVCNVSVVEVEVLFGLEEVFEGRDVGEKEFGGKKGLCEVCWFSIEDGVEFGWIIFGFDEERAGGRKEGGGGKV
jgi:hypothetical protein